MIFCFLDSISSENEDTFIGNGFFGLLGYHMSRADALVNGIYHMLMDVYSFILKQLLLTEMKTENLCQMLPDQTMISFLIKRIIFAYIKFN
mgnify:CR=1 FL=1